jgi:23S rRNA (cytidine1920-2'-O)/16S rRNA (cytidine1409-2'-O)-methyltransferase
MHDGLGTIKCRSRRDNGDRAWRYMVVKRSARISIVDLLVQRGLCPDPQTATKEVLAGRVYVADAIVDKVGAIVLPDAPIRLAARKEFVSRAAYKLDGALNLFAVNPRGKMCADVGACTGGFTEVLLQRGAARVFAIDVGYGDLDWKIRKDPRVTVLERTNARYVTHLAEPVSLVSIDVSFISLAKILPAVVSWLTPDADIIALIKPQFEAEKEEVGEGGIITDDAVHQRVINRVVAFLPSVDLMFQALEPSPILGSEGNKEFLLWAKRTARSDNREK